MVDNAAACIAAAGAITVLTGAGVSACSGIPTFREALTGIWARYDSAELATPEAFDADPERVSRWYDQRRRALLRCEPNAAHHALVKLERLARERGQSFTLATQNVDALHARAGSRGPLELHGSLLRWRNTQSGAEIDASDPEAIATYPPRDADGGLLRPAVVWFGELPPEEAWRRAEAAAAACDVILVVGTSAAVYPAAGLIDTARAAGATVIECNPEPALTGRDVIRLADAAEAVLPDLVDAVQSHAG